MSQEDFLWFVLNKLLGYKICYADSKRIFRVEIIVGPLTTDIIL
jgi:hypothetical protein